MSCDYCKPDTKRPCLSCGADVSSPAQSTVEFESALEEYGYAMLAYGQFDEDTKRMKAKVMHFFESH